MGKVSITKRRARYNPIGKSRGKPAQNNNSNKSNDEAVVSVINPTENLIVAKGTKGLTMACKKLEDSSDEEKVVGLNMLAAFSLDKQNAVLMIENSVAEKISPLMLHDNLQIQLAATGALCNLSDAAPDNMIEALVAQKVMKNLCSLLKGLAHLKEPPASEKTKFSKGIAVPLEESDQTVSTLVYAMGLLSRLCESNSDVLALANAAGIVQVIINFVNPDPWGYTLTTAVAFCLLCLTEDNPSAFGAVIPHAHLLVELLKNNQNSYAGLHFCNLISGILINLQYCEPNSVSFNQIFEVLSATLQIDLGKLFMACTIKYNLSEFHSGLNAQMLSLELLANWCYGDEDSETCEISDIEEEMDVEYTGGADISQCNEVSEEVFHAIKSHNLPVRTLGIVNQMTSPSFDLEKLRESDVEDVKCRVDLLRTRSLQCLHNLICPLSSEDFGNTNGLLDSWNVLLLQLSKSHKDEQDSLYLEAASDAMRAIMAKLCKENSPSLSGIGEEQLQMMLAISSETILPVKANFSRMLGTLGCHLVNTNSEENLLVDPSRSVLGAITEFMLKTVESSSEIWIAAEAFDVLIDLYSEDKTDILARDFKLVTSLSILHGPFKAKYKKRRKKLGEHRALVTTVADNLRSFIDYKKKRLTSINGT